MKYRIVTTIAILTLVSLSLPFSALSGSPPAPAGLTAVAGNEEASLNWNAASGATSYLVYKRVGSSGPYGYVAETKGTGYTSRGLWNGYTFQFVVTALNAEGQSPYSEPVSVVPISTLLKAPTNLSVVTGNAAATLTWESVTNAVYYNVYRSTSMGGPYTRITGGADQPPAPAGPLFTDRNLANGTDYYYVVQSMSTAPGAYSEEASVRPSSLLPALPELTVSPGSTWAALTWTAVPGASYYLVYRDTSEGLHRWLDAAPITNAYEATGLENGTTYFFAVSAVNATGTGAISNEVSVTPSLTQKPHAPKLSGVIQDKTVGVSWDSAVGATYLILYRSTPPEVPYTEIVTGPTSWYYWDTNLTNGTLYCYMVRAYNNSTTSVDSNEVCLTPVATPPVPANVKVVPGNAQATVTWDPVVGGPSYGVYMNGSGCEYSDRTDTPAFTCKGLLNNMTYSFSVCAPSGSANCSPGVSGKTSDSLPLAPTIRGGEAGNGEIMLTWNEVPGAASYKVYRTTKATAWPSDPVGTSTIPIFLEKGLSNDVDYYYRVAAVNDSGEGASSGEYHIRPSASALLPSPVNVTVIPGNGQATVTWKPVAGARDYGVSFAETPGGGTVKECASVSSTPSCTVTGLTNTHTYYVRIHTNLNTSAGTKSVPVSVVPSIDLPFAPMNVRTTAGNGETTLTWDTVAGAASYRVYRTTARTAWPSAPVTTTTGNVFNDTGLSQYETYYYRVAAVNANGTGSWSEEASVRTGMTPHPAPLRVAVIPGNTQATVTWDPGLGAAVYSAEATETPGGATVQSCTGPSPACTIKDLPGGMYYFHVHAGEPWGAASTAVCAALSENLLLAPSSVGTVTGNSQITFWWNPVPDAAGYRVYRSVAGGAWSVSPVGTVTGTYFTDSGLANGVQYSYAVSAENQSGPGAWSGIASATPSESCASAPVTVLATPGNQQIIVTWDPAPGATGYRAKIANSPGGNEFDTCSGTATTCIFKALTNEQTYYLRVQSSFGNSWCALSNEVRAVPSPAANFGNITGKLSVNIPGYTSLPVRSATITLQGSDKTATTDAEGNFTLLNVPYGNYQLVVTAEKMDTLTQNVTLAQGGMQLTLPQLNITSVCPVCPTCPACPTVVPGDANGDGRADLDDVIYILQVLTQIR